MKRLSPFILVLGFMFPIEAASAVGCAQVKTMIKSLGANSNLRDVKGAKSMVNAYETAFKNPKCISSKELVEMKRAAKDLIAECAKPNNVYRNLFSKPVYSAFCGGFKNLGKYTK